MSIIEHLVARVAKTCHNYKLFSRGDRVLVAVSGGADSVCLLHSLVLLQKTLQIELGIVHLNHGFRGEESDSEELFTKALAFKLKIPFFSTKKELLNIVKKERGSTQMVARDYRYGFFDQIASEYNFDKIALAHNLDDRVETFFLKILNGSSPAALASIPFSRNKYVRPLQEVNRFEILEFLKMINEKFVSDSSNLSNKYQRNFIRNTIFPELEGKFCGFQKRVIQLSKTIQEENLFWKELFSKQNSWGMKLNKDEVSFDLEQMRLAPLPLVKRIISEYAAFISEGKTLPPSPFYEKLNYFLTSSTQNRIWFEGKNLIIFNIANKVMMRKAARDSRLESLDKVLFMGENKLSNTLILALELSEPFSRNKKFFKQEAKNGIFWIDSKKIIIGNLKVRYRQNGDFIFIAAKKRKKIKDVLINDKINKDANEIFIIDNQGEQAAFFVYPCHEQSRVSYSYLASNNNEKLLRLQIKELGGHHE